MYITKNHQLNRYHLFDFFFQVYDYVMSSKAYTTYCDLYRSKNIMLYNRILEQLLSFKKFLCELKQKIPVLLREKTSLRTNHISKLPLT